MPTVEKATVVEKLAVEVEVDMAKFYRETAAKFYEASLRFDVMAAREEPEAAKPPDNDEPSGGIKARVAKDTHPEEAELPTCKQVEAWLDDLINRSDGRMCIEISRDITAGYLVKFSGQSVLRPGIQQTSLESAVRTAGDRCHGI